MNVLSVIRSNASAEVKQAAVELAKAQAKYEKAVLNAKSVWVDSDNEDEQEITVSSSAPRMRQKRRRDNSAEWFYRNRLHNGTNYLPAIQNCTAAQLVEGLAKVLRKEQALASIYPERTYITGVTFKPMQKRDAWCVLKKGRKWWD